MIAGVIWWTFGRRDEGAMVELYTVDEETVAGLIEEVLDNESADPRPPGRLAPGRS